MQALLCLLILALPVAALASRRVPSVTLVRYAIAWIVVFGVAVAVVSAFR